MIHVIGPRDPIRQDAINTTSRSKNWSRSLSPFFLGPVELYDGHVAKNVENAWQFSKIYPEHTDKNGDPSADYFRWAQEGWSDSRAHRYPMGKGRKPLYSFWNGDRLSYIEARKRIYIPIYAAAVVKTEAYSRLKQLAQDKDLWLWDFDGYDHRALGMSFAEVVDHPVRKMGHAFVLMGLLEGELSHLLC